MSKRTGEQSEPISEDRPLDLRTAELLEKMSEEDWLAVYNALVIYACKRCARHGRKTLRWKTGQVRGAIGTRDSDKDANLPDGFSPEAIAQEAITRLFRGVRIWNHEEHPGETPLEFLEGTVDSIVSGLIQSSGHKGTAYLHEEETRNDGEGGEYRRETVETGAAESLASGADPEQQAYLQSVVERIRERISNRADLTKFLELSMDGMRRREIAERMGVKPERVSELRSQFLEHTGDIYQELVEPRKAGVGKKGGAGGASLI